MPNYPANTGWLSDAESALAQWRLAREYDGEGDEVEDSVFSGLKQSLADPKSWLLVLIQTGAVMSMSFTCTSFPPFSSITCRQGKEKRMKDKVGEERRGGGGDDEQNGTDRPNKNTDFFPSIVQTLGYPRVETLLLTAPPYFASCIYAILNSWHSGRAGERCFHIVTGCCISIVGQILSTATHNLGARYFVSLRNFQPL